MKKLVLVAAVFALIFSAMSFVAFAADKVGCASCHTGNYSLENEVKNIAKHPPVPNATFDSCMKCHKAGKLAFGPILHKAHLTGDDNHFVTNYGGECTACHVLDAASGTYTIAK